MNITNQTKLSDLPKEFRYFIINLSNEKQYIVTENVLENILAAKSNFISLPNKDGFNKAFVVNWEFSASITRRKILEKKEKELEKVFDIA